MQRKKSNLSYQEVLSKLMRYCSYQERSKLDVRLKMKTLSMSTAEQEELFGYLEAEDFINEERFAKLFVRGKVNVKRWGIYKIREALYTKGIKSDLVALAIKEIDLDAYNKNLEELTDKKMALLKGDETIKEKLYRYLLSKGYESNLVVQQLKGKGLM